MDGLPIPGEWILQGGAGALVALTVWMILTGRLIPRATLSKLEQERDLWRSVALKAMGHADALLPAAQIATEVTRALGDATSASVERALAGTPDPPGERAP